MLYIIGLVIIILLLAIYMWKNTCKDMDQNVMDDISTLNVSKEELKKHAVEISSIPTTTRRKSCKRKLINNLDISYKKILQGYDFIGREIKDNKEVVNSAEWLLDNLYLIQKEYKDIKSSMPEVYYKSLPILTRGFMKGYPRIYYIAVEMLTHTDGKVDEEIIETFINTYQESTILTSGELWAFPIMIRIALIQNISKITERIVFAQRERRKGERIAEEIINRYSDEEIQLQIEKLKGQKLIFTSHFTERLIKVLRDNLVDNEKIYQWIDEALDKQESNSERMINIEHQKQGAYQVSIGNSINGIREISALNWSENFEKLSYVEQVLREDPEDIYKNMSFRSRDYYRHKIEKLSKTISVPESFIAKKAVECAKEACEKEYTKEYERHVGYYIIDEGLECLKKKISSSKEEYKEVDAATFAKGNVNLYIGTIIFGTAFLTFLIAGLNYYEDGNLPLWKYIVALIVILIPSSEIFISILNWSINKLTEPRFVPKMEFKEGIPEEYSTVVVIPTLLNDVDRVKSLVKDIEVYYLANEEKNLYFALLGDFKDSDKEHEENDDLIVETALKSIKELNSRYSDDEKDIFYFFNRYRQYNEKEGIWLGWERKRGKLMEFNLLLRGDKDTSYNVASGEVSNLYGVKYVITLDADTQLPRDSAKLLIGSMAHILNRPYIDEESKRVVRGHGLMQPRVSVGALSANKTLHSSIFSGETGIDRYTGAISDVYEDLFDEGIFTGKGIYDIDTFNKMLKDQIPENSVLSHDLLEGSYVRAALVTDIELIDGYPAYYNSSSKRLHRWVRGDWQLLPWLFKKNSLNKLSRWKIFDNLRRSLLAPSIIILIIMSMILFDMPDKWLAIALISLLCPIFFDVSEAVISPIKGISLSGKVSSGKNAIEQFFLIFSFLPYQAYMMLDAIVRTLYRLFVSKKHMLQWETAADVEANSGKELSDYIRSMWVGSAISIFILLIAFQNSLDLGFLILPSCVIWLFSPWLAYNISIEKENREKEINEEEKETLRRLSRKTWAYFEDFVADENNWLAPDNYQEDPDKGLANRTSPTNMGMGITSNIVAYDLGYIGIVELQERLEKVISSMESLETYRGHFYNWYDTKTKAPLHPRYISTVDSGNLVSYIWLTIEALSEYIEQPIFNRSIVVGLGDTLKLADREIEEKLGIKGVYEEVIDELKQKEFDIIWWKRVLSNLWSKSSELTKDKSDLYWNEKVKNIVIRSTKEIQLFFPWVDVVESKQEELGDLKNRLENMITEVPLENFIEAIDDIVYGFKGLKANSDSIDELITLIETSKADIGIFISKIKNIKDRLYNIDKAQDFKMLYNERRQLFAIGYDVENDTIGNSYYDLLASEARQASFIAIAKGEIEQSHWFKLGRSMALVGGGKGLVSWTGTMFEYLMPLIIMKNYPNTLLSQTYKYVVEGHRRYGKQRNVPWGISESAYYNFDVNQVYQYKAFGVPGIGLKRGLANEVVIAPYATIMALQVDFKAALDNIYKLMELNMEGRYGFYEAIDYTRERMPKGKKNALVKCFMVHHQGMSLMSLDNVLMENILQERFHRIPRVKAVELLLQERASKAVVYDREEEYRDSDLSLEKQNIIARKYNTPDTEMPEAHIMSNGSYSLMVTNSGSGYSKRDDMTIYRWREDATTDDTGMFFYIKNLNSNEYWSATYEPCKHEGEEYEVAFSLDKAEFKRKDGNLRTHTEVTVSTEDNAEVRRISITNNSDYSRDIEITSYCEVTLAPYSADLVHPTFSNLFIKTEFVDSPRAVIANRRPRAKGSKKPWVMQTVSIDGKLVGSIQYETSRLNFIGRGRDLINPKAMDNDAQLDMTVGAVLDPIISIRVRVKLEKGETCRIAYSTAVADSREEVLGLASKYSDMNNIDRIFELSWTGVQVEMKYLGIKSSQANIYQMMASKILFLNPLLKTRGQYIMNIRKGQSSLWPYGISGDLPIVLVIIRSEKDTDLVRQLLSAHEYWSLKGLKVDLVLLNLQNSSYIQPLQDAVRDLISSSHARDKQNEAGGVFLHSKATIAEEDIDLFIAIARLVIDSKNGSVFKQISIEGNDLTKDIEMLSVDNKEYISNPYKFELPKLEYFNDIGGFSPDGKSYIIVLKDYQDTPAPWINVISNGSFGFHVSESGIAYTWNKNSRENKLTTWSNDPIMDSEAEDIYIRDEVTGDVWSISPKPIRDSGEYIIEHGFGYSTFKHEVKGIIGEMTMFVDMNESVKLCKIKLKNNSNEERKLSVSYYAKLVLGVAHEQTAQYIFTDFNKKHKYIYARNPYSEHFGNLIAYMKAVGGEELSYTGNRKEFIGRGGNVKNPKAITFKTLSNTVGAGMDPCLAKNIKLTLDKNSEKEVLILLGQGDSFEDIDRVVEKYSNLEKAYEELKNTKEYWEKLFSTVQVKTPDKSMDIMLNGWLMYQVISCRYWARTAFYQSGGAYGFRDQLQDVMAISYLNSNITREHIVYSASKQYLEGDVQHWWHPVVESGIRTRFSDDLLWLPYVTIDYIQNTGDYSILDEVSSYLEDDELKEGEDERYNISRVSEKKGTIYEHCVKAIERSLKFGSHNIPLMGSGDWNDGMSTVGNGGKGESVWLGWFLYSILDKFVNICDFKEEREIADKYRKMKEFIKENLEKNAWDGGWYRRAYFDDGTPLGSLKNDECQIDSLSQSWSVISGAAKESRAKEAMEALQRNLVKEDKGIVLLLTPAFDNSFLEPGYIKGYVPGVRENGGQYTHASIWVILALAKMGCNNKAWKIFNMINPINHAKSNLNCQVYKVEPYVMTADVYAVEPHTGRGGWSWYTGAAGWMYKSGIEGILGLKFKENKGFTIEPCVPDDWKNYSISYNKGSCQYNINVIREEEKGIWLDGEKLEDKLVPFLENGEHEVKVHI